MNCFLTADTDELIVGQEAVLENCLHTLQKISGEAEASDIKDLQFPTLPPLTQQQVQQEQRYCPYNRGLTPDGFSDTWLKKTQCWALIADLWNLKEINRLTRCFEARLIALNRMWPDIFLKDQFRPIVVLSPIFKWLERRFILKL